MSLATLIVLAIQLSLALMVFSIGLAATVGDVTYLFRRPKLLIRSLLSMNVVMPLFAAVLALSFDLRPVVKGALVLLAVSPVPPIFPRKALKAGGWLLLHHRAHGRGHPRRHRVHTAGYEAARESL